MLNFVSVLKQRAATTEGKRKRERTRDRLLLATAEGLESSGFNALRVIDITEHASLAEGTFYLYFKDKREAAIEVLQSFLLTSVAVIKPVRSSYSAFESIRAANLRWLESAKHNPGLMRALFQLSDQDADFAEYYADQNFRWHTHVASTVLDRYPQGAVDESLLAFSTAALGAMMDEMTRQMFVSGVASKTWGASAPGRRIGDLADTLSVIWFQVLFPGAPLEAKLLKPAQRQAALDGRQADLG